MTTDTTTLPALAEAMTARDIRAYALHLESKCPNFASVHMSASNYWTLPPIQWAVTASGKKGEGHCETWPEAFAAAEAWIDDLVSSLGTVSETETVP
jgi:hypothetical protein